MPATAYVGFKKTLTADNARACSDYQQYIGQIVSGLEVNVVMGARRFPQNTLIVELEAEAKAQAGPALLEQGTQSSIDTPMPCAARGRQAKPRASYEPPLSSSASRTFPPDAVR